MKVLFLTLIPALSFAFTLNSDTGQGFDKNNITVQVSKDSCSGAGMSNGKFKSLVKKAVDEYWNAVPTSALKLSVSSTSKSVDGLDFNQALDKAKSGTILAACNDDVPQFDGSSSPGGVSTILGAAVMDCSGRSCRAVFLLNSHSTSQVADLSDSDVVATIAHELGHAIGLGHSEYKHNLMYFSAGGKTQKWLGEDDIDGVNYLYPEEANLGGLFGSCATIKTDNDSDSSGSGFIFSLALGIFLAFAIGIASKGRNYFA